MGKKNLILALLIILDAVLYVLYIITSILAVFYNNIICAIIAFPIVVLAAVTTVLIIDLIKKD